MGQGNCLAHCISVLERSNGYPLSGGPVVRVEGKGGRRQRHYRVTAAPMVTVTASVGVGFQLHRVAGGHCSLTGRRLLQAN